VSTRSVIARPTPEGGFGGTYCHYDGYPAHQGAILFDAVTGHFTGDPDAACYYLIDQHPAGWSVLHGDFTVPPGYRTGHDPQDLRNQCYCHGDRHEPPARRSPTTPPATPGWTTPTCWTPSGCGCSQPRRRVAAGGRPGLDRMARLGRHRPARPTPPPRVVAPPPARSPVAAATGYGNGPGGHRQSDTAGRLVFTVSPSWSAWVRVGVAEAGRLVEAWHGPVCFQSNALPAAAVPVRARGRTG
jgi:hypothetical protein